MKQHQTEIDVQETGTGGTSWIVYCEDCGFRALGLGALEVSQIGWAHERATRYGLRT